MTSEPEEDTASRKSAWRGIVIGIVVLASLIGLGGYLLWHNRASVVEVAIIDFFESHGFEVKSITVAAAETDGLTLEKVHLKRGADITIDRLRAIYDFDGIQLGKIDDLQIANIVVKRDTQSFTIGKTSGKASVDPNKPFADSSLDFEMTEIKANGQPIRSAKFRASAEKGTANAQLIVQVDLSRLQVNTETNFASERWPTKIKVDGLMYIKEITKLLDLDHPVSGWLTITGKGGFTGIQAFLGDKDNEETLEANGQIKLRARQFANFFGLSEGMAGSDKLTLDLINLRATRKFARTRFQLYTFFTGRVRNLFTYQNAKLNLEGVATSDGKEAKIRMEKGNLAIDLPIYLGDVFLRDQVEVGVHSLKNFIRYDYETGAIAYRMQLQPLPLFISIPTHRATVRTNWDIAGITAKSAGDGKHHFNVTVNTVDSPTYAVQASGIGLIANLANGTTNFDLEIAKIRQTDKVPVLVPLKVTAKATKKDGVLQGRFHTEAPSTGLSLKADYKYDFGKFIGDLTYKLAPLRFGPDGETIAKMSPLLATQVKAVTGSVAAHGGYRWRVGNVPDGFVQVTIDKMGAATETAKVSDIDATIKFNSLNPPATKTPQKITAHLTVGDLSPIPMDINWRINPSGSIALEPFTANFAGGTLSTTTELFDPESFSETFALNVDNVDLTEIFRLIGVEGLTGTGKLSGTIPIEIKDGKVIVKDGQLEALSPGSISLRGGEVAKALKQKHDTVAMALRALADFQYRKLTVRIDKSPGGEGVLKLRLEGSNPKVYKGHPFVFNINLESNFDNLAEFALRSLETADNVLKWAGGKYGLEARNPRTGKKLR
ncbi:MAG TPA: hypothetical protein DCE33_11420 [Rhodospirillaceae bacterium]|nr:hypothetical protein [Rhodospirillaceae bacterium]